jgi:hypothetical protein
MTTGGGPETVGTSLEREEQRRQSRLWLLPYLGGGIAAAVALVWLAGGGLFTVMLGFGVMVAGVFFAVVAGVLVYTSGYRVQGQRIGTGLVLVSGCFLLVLPLGLIESRMAVARARAWCEQAPTDPTEAGPPPRIVEYGERLPGQCWVGDTWSPLCDGWVFHLRTRTWSTFG